MNKKNSERAFELTVAVNAKVASIDCKIKMKRKRPVKRRFEYKDRS
jgi:hypothetical protein